MNAEEAMRILKALVEGTDPISLRPLPNDSVLQNPMVMRALLLAHAAIQSGLERQKRRAQLPARVGTTWTDQEDQKLITAWKEQKTVEEIAASHGRTVRAIESRLERMGLMTPEQRKTTNSFVGGGGAVGEVTTRRRRGRRSGGGDSSTISAAD